MLPHMSATDTAGEAAMLPRMVQMVMRIVAAGMVAHPTLISVTTGSGIQTTSSSTMIPITSAGISPTMSGSARLST